MPTGWFQIGWSGELAAPGEEGPSVKALRYFGADLVMYRGESGRVVVMDAHCQHMGAHLGHGGTVDCDEIVCPFHGWRWGPEGGNTSIPNADRPSRHRSMRTWPVSEIGELILVWYDPDHREPQWDPPVIPEFEDPEYYPVFPNAVMHWRDLEYPGQLLVENIVDPVHFKYVHGSDEVGILHDYEIHDHIFSVSCGVLFGGGQKSTWLTPNGPMVGRQDIECQGLGLIFTRYPDTDRAVQIDSCIPVSPTVTERRSTILARRPAESEGDTPTGAAAKRIRSSWKIVEMDFPIFENMRYMQQPSWTKDEAKAQSAIRKWAAGFYRGVATEVTL
jgi:nitrite reductase/ring-hydroxylating ferredoxin subunit